MSTSTCRWWPWSAWWCRQDPGGPADRRLGGVAGQRSPERLGPPRRARGDRPGPCPRHPGGRPPAGAAAGDRGGPAPRRPLGAQGRRADRGRRPRPEPGDRPVVGRSGRALPAGAGSDASDPGPPRPRRTRSTRSRKIRADRHFSWWTDPDGAFCYQGRDTADRGAALRLTHRVAGHTARPHRAGPRATRPPEPERALRADALFALVTGARPDPAGTVVDGCSPRRAPPRRRGRVGRGRTHRRSRRWARPVRPAASPPTRRRHTTDRSWPGSRSRSRRRSSAVRAARWGRGPDARTIFPLNAPDRPAPGLFGGGPGRSGRPPAWHRPAGRTLRDRRPGADPGTHGPVHGR